VGVTEGFVLVGKLVGFLVGSEVIGDPDGIFDGVILGTVVGTEVGIAVFGLFVGATERSRMSLNKNIYQSNTYQKEFLTLNYF
jgi:uncharacterized membrane protein YeaQ/YmgE (transglycosylase-associated protein family)